ncbi:MAG: enoyl-CoA hydratase, partial [Nevskiales bacterium]
ALAKARQLAAQPPNAQRITKNLLKRLQRTAVADTMRAESADFMRMLREPEALEAMTAIMQKRKPDFSKFN